MKTTDFRKDQLLGLKTLNQDLPLYVTSQTLEICDFIPTKIQRMMGDDSPAEEREALRLNGQMISSLKAIVKGTLPHHGGICR